MSQLGVVEVAFEAIAEERAKGLPLSDALEQPRGQPDASRREIDGQEIGVGGGGVRQVPAAQDGRRCRLGERGRVRIPRVVVRAIDDAVSAGHGFRGWRRRRFEVHDPPVPAEDDAGAALSAQFSEAFRRERCHPRVEAMRGEVDRARAKPLKFRRTQCFQMREAFAELQQRRDTCGDDSIRGCRLQFTQVRPELPIGDACGGSVQSGPRRVRVIEEFTVEGWRTRHTGRGELQSSGGRPVGEEHRVAKERIDQPARLNIAERLVSQRLEVGRVQQEVDVVGVERRLLRADGRLGHWTAQDTAPP